MQISLSNSIQVNVRLFSLPTHTWTPYTNSPFLRVWNIQRKVIAINIFASENKTKEKQNKRERKKNYENFLIFWIYEIR